MVIGGQGCVDRWMSLIGLSREKLQEANSSLVQGLI